MTGHTLEEREPVIFRAVLIRPDPILARIALAMLLSLLLTVPAWLLDDRLFQGDNVWLKPIKFQIALLVYFGTLAVLAMWLPDGTTRTPRMRLLLTLAGLAAIAEMLWIGGAAMFAVASHYNPQPLLSAIYLLMGAFAVLLLWVSLVFGVAFWRDRASALPDPVRLSLALGLILTFALSLLAAGTLASLPGRYVGVPVTGATLPLLGWSREVGDLRVAHFLATHALHAIPLVGLAAAALFRAPGANLVVWAGAAGFSGLTLFTYVQALGGRPFL
jgi:hypothetical protein